MDNQINEPLTETVAIMHGLLFASVGDELTIEDESGYRDNRTVQSRDGTHLEFGDPADNGRIVDIGRATTHKLTGDPDHPLSTGMEITKLWVW